MTLRGPVVKRRIAAKEADVANSQQELRRNCVRWARIRARHIVTYGLTPTNMLVAQSLPEGTRRVKLAHSIRSVSLRILRPVE